MRLPALVVVVIGLVSSSTVHAAGLKDEATVRALADKAMALLAKEKVKEAMESFVPYWPLPRPEVDVAVAKIIEQRTLFPDRFGKPVGVKFVEQKVVAGTVLRILYLEKFENHAIRWTFLFYRPATDWRFNAFTFDDKLQALFEPGS